MSRIIKKKQGIGIGYRGRLDRFTLANAELIDVLEVIPEHFIRDGIVAEVPKLQELKSMFNIVVHGVSSSIVSATKIDQQYLRLVRQIVEVTGSLYFSDHASMTSTDGFSLGHLCPNIYTPEVLKLAVDNSKRIMDIVGVPLVMEYSTYSLRFAGSTWTPEEFYAELMYANPELGMLLDLSNVWYNGSNFGFDYQKFICDLPQDRIVHIHLAGGEFSHGFWVDTHSHALHDEVLGLLSLLCETADPDTIIIERDDNYGEAVKDLPQDLERIREIVGFEKVDKNGISN